MSQNIELTYEVKVELEKEYKINVIIGNANDGDISVFGTCPFKTNPIKNDPDWISVLGKGSEIKNKVLFITSTTQLSNPSTVFVSVRIDINEEKLLPIKGKSELSVEKEEIVYFNQKINFI